MKKSISKMMVCLFSLSLLLSNIVHAADSVLVSQKVLTAFDLLQTLGVVENELDVADMDFTKEISRGDFAVYLYRMLNLPSTSGGTLYYNDLPKTHYAYQAVTALTEYGYLSGTGDKVYHPDEVMKLEYVYPLMAKALGMKAYFDSNNFDSRVMTNVLSDAKIASGVQGGENLIIRDMLVIFYNTLLADTYDIHKVVDGNISYQPSEDSLLYQTRKMRFLEKKQVTAALGADLNGVLTDDSITIVGEQEFHSEKVNTGLFLGRYVDFVYYDSSDDDEIIWMQKSASTEELSFRVDQNCTYSQAENALYYFDENGKEQKAKLSGNISVIYNGAFVTVGISSIFSMERYELTLIESQGASDYDIAIVEAYQNIWVGDKDSQSMTIYDKNSGNSVCLDEDFYQRVQIVNGAGTAMKYEDIMTNDVVSVFLSANGRYLKAVVFQSVMKGTVGSVDSDGKITVNDAVYEFDSGKIPDAISAGVSVSCYLDFKGYIAHAEVSFVKDGQFVGFAVQGIMSEGVSPVIKLKLLKETGDLAVYQTNSKLYIDDFRYSNIGGAFAKLSSGGVFSPQLLCCQTNSDGEITRIYTAQADDGIGHPLVVSNIIDKSLDSKWKGTFRSAQNRVGKKMLINSSTKVFFIPENIEDAKDSDFTIGNLAAEGDYRGAVSYRTATDSFYEGYIVVRQSEKVDISTKSAIFVMDTVTSILNSDGEDTFAIRCFDGSAQHTYEVDTDVDVVSLQLKSCDAFQLGVDRNGLVKSINLLYSAGTSQELHSSLDWPDAEGRILTCYGYDKSGDIVKVGYNSGADYDEVFKIASNKPVIIYNSEYDKVYNGTTADILTYKTSGAGASKLLIQSNYSDISKVIVYR